MSGPRGRVTMPATDLLAQLGTDEVGLMITDPPWKLTGGPGFRGGLAGYDLLSPEDVADLLREAARVVKPGAHLYLFLPSTGMFFDALQHLDGGPWQPIRLLAWDKGARRGLGAYRNAFEPVVILANGDSRGYRGPSCKYNSLLTQKTKRGRTQKPWQLYRIFMLMSADPKEVVVDPFCGTNPLGKAVRRMEREQPWLAGDILPPEEVADQVREPNWLDEAGETEKWGNTQVERTPHEQARLPDPSEGGGGP